MTYNIRRDDLDRLFYYRAEWNLKFSFLPHRCDFSNKLIWLEYAYQGVRYYHGPGEPVCEIRWLTKGEFIFGKLKEIIP